MAGSTKALLLLFYLSLLVGVALAQEDDNVDVVEAGGGDEEDPNNIELDTYLGPIIGKRVEREGPDGGSIAHYEFLGIPYAEPPVDELRSSLSFRPISIFNMLVRCCTELAKKVCTRLRDSAYWCIGEITQPRTNIFGQLCTVLS